jgi:hypothetical protein
MIRAALLFLFCATAQADWKFTGYTCLPKTRDEVRIAKDGNVNAAVWYCDTPSQIKSHYFTWNSANESGFSLTATYDRVKALLKPARAPSQAEYALVLKLHEAEGIRITVSTNGTAKDRPVYSRLANNTRGPIVSARAEVGSECGTKRLQDASGKATSYFEVEGGYTLCKLEGVVSK